MGKMRIYEFAKELGKESGEIIAALGLRGHVTASSGITEADKEKVRKKLFGEGPKAAPKAPEKVEAPKAAPETQSSKDNAAEEAPKKEKDRRCVPPAELPQRYDVEAGAWWKTAPPAPGGREWPSGSDRRCRSAAPSPGDSPGSGKLGGQV